MIVAKLSTAFECSWTVIIIIIISDSVQNLKGVWVHNTNTKVQGAKLQSVVYEIT